MDIWAVTEIWWRGCSKVGWRQSWGEMSIDSRESLVASMKAGLDSLKEHGLVLRQMPSDIEKVATDIVDEAQLGQNLVLTGTYSALRSAIIDALQSERDRRG